MSVLSSLDCQIGATPVRHGDIAWIVLACSVLAYEAIAPRRGWELLSTACDRYRTRHPILTNTAITITALHLMRRIPARYDPLHRLAEGHP